MLLEFSMSSDNFGNGNVDEINWYLGKIKTGKCHIKIFMFLLREYRVQFMHNDDDFDTYGLSYDVMKNHRWLRGLRGEGGKIAINNFLWIVKRINH
jgi:hypothetical protein